MIPQRFSLDVIVFMILFFRDTNAGFCLISYACSRSCSIKEQSYTGCGLFSWWTCTTYKTQETTCYSTCYQRECCPGYSGTSCDTPICNSGCSADGVCSAPDTCSCNYGYQILADGRTCIDIDECTSGTANCQHGCVNTNGSYLCTCNAGFEPAGPLGNMCQEVTTSSTSPSSTTPTTQSPVDEETSSLKILSYLSIPIAAVCVTSIVVFGFIVIIFVRRRNRYCSRGQHSEKCQTPGSALFLVDAQFASCTSKGTIPDYNSELYVDLSQSHQNGIATSYEKMPKY